MTWPVDPCRARAKYLHGAMPLAAVVAQQLTKRVIGLKKMPGTLVCNHVLAYYCLIVYNPAISTEYKDWARSPVVLSWQERVQYGQHLRIMRLSLQPRSHEYLIGERLKPKLDNTKHNGQSAYISLIIRRFDWRSNTAIVSDTLLFSRTIISLELTTLLWCGLWAISSYLETKVLRSE